MSPQQLQALIFPIGIFVIFYFFGIRPQKKREKEIQQMRSELRVGDEIVTIGGIRGKIILIKEDMITLEVSSTKTRLDVTKWAIGSVIKKNESKNAKKDQNEDN
ncbi:preprotein translocase subunit YajC [Wansuia hejianensis]|uniref:Preprotein translocase subunit YajC n=1 Tax=Wansuia hejianensis TaxID=2763667 RepID=A0A926IH92_9FIRM|nr:preprotein translocase subunit YajC [Wansuia hejianensis]MBC8590412.1 preprotein translocase subunit YajC [Wansuia hejianensis]